MYAKAGTVLRYAGWSLLGSLLTYGLGILVGGLIPVNAPATAEEAVTVYIAGNGLHAGFVMPVDTMGLDWRAVFPIVDYEGVDSSYRYVLVGWGERGFYLDTPTWRELKAGTVLRALFWPSAAAVHVDYRRRPPPAGRACRPLRLSDAQYRRLTEYVQAALARDNAGRPRLIAGKGYTAYDNFYEANGRYHLFFTCNDWVNRGLKRLGVRTALWSPLAWGVMRWREKG